MPRPLPVATSKPVEAPRPRRRVRWPSAIRARQASPPAEPASAPGGLALGEAGAEAAAVYVLGLGGGAVLLAARRIGGDGADHPADAFVAEAFLRRAGHHAAEGEPVLRVGRDVHQRLGGAAKALGLGDLAGA